MIDTLYLTQFDLQPFYYVTVTDSSNVVVDLTGATIRVSMSDVTSTTLVINRSTVGLSITGATSGQFEYQWQSGDTDSTGTYEIEFEVTPSSGGKYTIPNPFPSQSTSMGKAKVKIEAGLDAT